LDQLIQISVAFARLPLRAVCVVGSHCANLTRITAITRFGIHSLVVRISLILGVAVLLSIGLVSGISYFEIARTTKENSTIRIDRAAKTAAAVIRYGTDRASRPRQATKTASRKS
jgi:hypothetical protein